MNKRKLYETIMRNVSKHVKKALNEMSDRYIEKIDVKEGDRIKILRMDDNGGKDIQAKKYKGAEGVVLSIDSMG